MERADCVYKHIHTHKLLKRMIYHERKIDFFDPLHAFLSNMEWSLSSLLCVFFGSSKKSERMGLCFISFSIDGNKNLSIHLYLYLHHLYHLHHHHHHHGWKASSPV